ncbi:MAG: 4a-hydroxytetrahydrobiopterin dehydratase [Chloroflexi bacterium]|jgi:4a-hydroxytetrahydrobiopterin dehydratase|uniref:Putative pterin-4-alpha-carbinolamine dehydratase n=1 Tax=Candidatus Thermofonsia Clade 3 bacterium TaxID=2364212 RepID=A0A2M8QET6_9CHLR|nr:4a-hydroxytetrahydrobiopterin dehydratase [Candidatus Roseilinea sp. NK_OTU-006]PJF48325.1 MAG: 4a-hydroxytetrahydrobiopterin dehydratase [Candidatus Thermofonsia Clade 3 bacterium]RMG62254.1 MAG: 4a-hydroxytetrahydrobiopterin dehydratase [Chloroflexota bacterium]
MAKLDDAQIQERLAHAEGWRLNEAGEITKTFVFSGFPQSLMFATAVGVLAEAAQHHPDITIQWNKVTLALTTHDAGGLTDKDFDLARQIDGLPH